MPSSDRHQSRADTASVSWLRLPQPERPAPAVAALQQASLERLGYVRNLLKVPFQPEHLAAFQAYIDLLVRGPGGRLSFREREFLALIVSVENRCEACVIAHATALERHGAEKALVDTLAINFRRADLSPREHALATFAAKLTTAPQAADESYIEGLRSAGLDEVEIAEAAQIVALFNFTNRLNSVLGIKIDPKAHDNYRSHDAT